MAPKRDRPGQPLNTAPALVYVDTDLRVRFASRHCHELLGHDPDTLHGRELRDLVDTATLRFARLHVAEVEQGSAASREYALRCKDGTKMTVQVSALADRDASGRSVGYLLRTESELEPRFSVPLEAAEASFWIWDLLTRSEHYSRGFKDLLGYADADFPPQFRFFAAIHPEDRSATADALATAIRDGGRFDREFRLRAADDSWRWIRGIGQAAPGGGAARAARFEVVAHDISARKRPELIAAANHALRTPLASIIAALELLQHESLPTAVGTPESLLALALENADRLAQVVEQWLDMERLDAGAVHLHSAPLEVEPAVSAAIAQLGGSRAAIVRFPAAGTSNRIRVDADGARLQQALTHLIGACVDRSAPGCPVTVSLDARGGRAVITIDDEAPHRAPGPDLGLLVTEAIVKRFNGALRASPCAGKGNRVTLELPCLEEDARG